MSQNNDDIDTEAVRRLTAALWFRLSLWPGQDLIGTLDSDGAADNRAAVTDWVERQLRNSNDVERENCLPLLERRLGVLLCRHLLHARVPFRESAQGQAMPCSGKRHSNTTIIQFPRRRSS